MSQQYPPPEPQRGFPPQQPYPQQPYPQQPYPQQPYPQQPYPQQYVVQPPYPGMPGVPAPKRSRVGLVLAGLAVGLVVLAVIGFLGLLALGAASSGDSRPAPTVTPTVTSSPTLAADGRTVTTACYTFALPEQYEIRPTSVGCRTFVNVPNSDVLTAFDVSPVAGNGDDNLTTVERQFRAKVESAGGRVTAIDRKTYGGLDGILATYVSEIGIKSKYVYVVERTPRWRAASGGLIGGYTIDGSDLPQFDEIAESITFT